MQTTDPGANWGNFYSNIWVVKSNYWEVSPMANSGTRRNLMKRTWPTLASSCWRRRRMLVSAKIQMLIVWQ